jgi:hypothetical protein
VTPDWNHRLVPVFSDDDDDEGGCTFAIVSFRGSELLTWREAFVQVKEDIPSAREVRASDPLHIDAAFFDSLEAACAAGGIAPPGPDGIDDHGEPVARMSTAGATPTEGLTCLVREDGFIFEAMPVYVDVTVSTRELPWSLIGEPNDVLVSPLRDEIHHLLDVPDDTPDPKPPTQPAYWAASQHYVDSLWFGFVRYSRTVELASFSATADSWVVVTTFPDVSYAVDYVAGALRHFADED